MSSPVSRLGQELRQCREGGVSRLLAAFDGVAAEGTPELVLVSGYSGVGKSSVVNELHKVLVTLFLDEELALEVWRSF